MINLTIRYRSLLFFVKKLLALVIFKLFWRSILLFDFFFGNCWQFCLHFILIFILSDQQEVSRLVRIAIVEEIDASDPVGENWGETTRHKLDVFLLPFSYSDWIVED